LLLNRRGGLKLRGKIMAARVGTQPSQPQHLTGVAIDHAAGRGGIVRSMLCDTPSTVRVGSAIRFNSTALPCPSGPGMAKSAFWLRALWGGRSPASLGPAGR